MSEPAPTSDPREHTTPNRRSAASIPARIGRYTIDARHAEGGNGTIYIAQQDEPRREVALKVMRPGVASARALRRFRNEAQTLARLGDHPGIAQIFEACTDGEGLDAIPYFAMEYIRGGLPITVAAAKQNLSLRERVALMQKVCEAVAHGHRKGILHRDLKPSNILLDPAGRPKVIDFGIARAVDADMVPSPLRTQPGQLLGTPWYMSPEQARGDTDTLTCASDVYSLGVVLYELACNALPYDLIGKSTIEVLEVIREQPPRRPALALRKYPDLTTILAVALHKESRRRYQNAGELAEDLERFLDGKPIRARGDSIAYLTSTRLKTAATRSPYGARIACVTLAALLGIAAGYLLAPEIVSLALQRHSRGIFAIGLPVTRFDHVRIITRRSSPAAATGAPGAGREKLGLLLTHLAPARARVVALDYYFPPLFDPANPLMPGVKAVQAADGAVVIGAVNWGTGPNTVPPGMDPAVAALGRSAGITIGADPKEAWYVDLFLQRAQGVWVEGLALAAFDLWTHPGQPPRIDVSRDDGAAILRFDDPARTAVAIEFNLESPLAPQPEPQPPSYPATAQAASFGIDAGEFAPIYGVEIPAQPVIDAATITEGEALRASPDQLRAWFAGRAVVVGGIDPGPESDVYPYHDGRVIPGYVAHATALEQLLRDFSFRTASPLVLFLIACAAALIGAAVDAGRRGIRAAVAVVFAAITFVGGAVLALRFGGVLINPIAPMIALCAAAFGCRLLCRWRTQAMAS